MPVKLKILAEEETVLIEGSCGLYEAKLTPRKIERARKKMARYSWLLRGEPP